VSIFTALVVDLAESGTPNRCVGGRAYIADAWGYGLIVFDSLSGRSWRIEHESMKPSPPLVRLARSSNSQAGIFTVSLSPSEVEGKKYPRYSGKPKKVLEFRQKFEIVNEIISRF